MSEKIIPRAERAVVNCGHQVIIRRIGADIASAEGRSELEVAGHLATVRFSSYYGRLRFALRAGGPRGELLHEGTTDWHRAGAEWMLAGWWLRHLGLDPIPFEKPNPKRRRGRA